MLDRNTGKWLVRWGALAALLLVVAALAIVPTIAQGGRGNLAGHDQATEASTSARSDDPAGRMQVPVGDRTAPQSNQAAGAEKGTPLGRTDDPLGRVMIPLSGDAPAGSNVTASAGQDASASSHGDTDAVTQEAQAIESYQSPLVIPAADFRDDGADPDSFFFWFAGGYAEGNSSNYGCMMAPAYLPHGAIVAEMWVSLYDNDTTHSIYVTLWRVDNYDGTAEVMAEVTTTDAYAYDGITVLSDNTINGPIVEYPGYSYYATSCLRSSSIRLYSVRVYYEQYYLYLPITLRGHTQ